jgi:peptidoglycan/xylan/chitin deacetylase (PgdA/CDA1 family)
MRKIVWKAEARCAVGLTFDVDGETLWISKDPANENRLGVLSQGAYGPKVGVPLILDLLERFALHATFFVPGWIVEHYPQVIELIHRDGHEIGHHGYKHEWPDSEHPEIEQEVLLKGIEAIKTMTGEAPCGYRSPAWELTPNTLNFLKAEGFLYSSNLMDDLIPYLHPQDIVELPVQWLLDDAPFFLFQTRIPSRPIWPAEFVLKAWQEEFHGIYRYGGFFNLTMHPQFIGRPGRLQMLERLFQRIVSYPDVWVAPLKDVALYWKETQS